MLPHALDLVPDLRTARRRAGSLLLGLDFDGTLAPIVPRPEDAALPEAIRPLLEAVAARRDTRVALVSGRGLRDLAARVAIDGVYYAGNHGLEIEGPDVHRVHPQAQDAAGRLAALARTLEQALAATPGAIVEDKGLTLSIHYRMVDDEPTASHVRETVETAAAGESALRLTHGKKVVEVRPDVDWHKGRALRFLRRTLEERFAPGPAVFIGDDRTDEDAFEELGDGDFAIVVGDPPPAATAARAFLRSTDDVAGFLRLLEEP